MFSELWLRQVPGRKSWTVTLCPYHTCPSLRRLRLLVVIRSENSASESSHARISWVVGGSGQSSPNLSWPRLPEATAQQARGSEDPAPQLLDRVHPELPAGFQASTSSGQSSHPYRLFTPPSPQIVTIQIHHLIPSRHEVFHKRLLRIVTGINLRDGPQL